MVQVQMAREGLRYFPEADKAQVDERGVLMLYADKAGPTPYAEVATGEWLFWQVEIPPRSIPQCWQGGSHG